MIAGGSQQRFEAAPHLGAKLFGAVGATLVATFPTLDPLLRGMVAAGQGIQAICLYLGLTRIAFDEHLVRLGLPTPHDRPPRSGGRRPWSLLDTVRLMAWRMAGAHPETIALRLDRSVGSIRSKARRLGVPAPDRKDLVRLDPDALPEVRMDWWRTGCSVRHLTPLATPKRPRTVRPETGAAQAAARAHDTGRAAAARAARPSVHVVPEPAGQPGEAAGPLFGGPERAHIPSSAKVARPVRAAPSRNQSASPVPGQRQMPLLQIVPPASAAAGSTDQATSSTSAVTAAPQNEAEIDFNGDLTWIGRVPRPIQKNKLAVFAIGMLFLGGLRWIEVSDRIGIRPTILKDLRRRLGIPKCDRAKITRTFEPERAFETQGDAGYVVRRCRETGHWFWAVTGDGMHLCPDERRRRGYRDENGGHSSPWVNVLTWQDIEEMKPPPRRGTATCHSHSNGLDELRSQRAG